MTLTGKNFRNTEEENADVIDTGAENQNNEQSSEHSEQNNEHQEQNDGEQKDDIIDWDDLKDSFKTDEDGGEEEQQREEVQVQEEAAEVKNEADKPKEWWQKAAEVTGIKAESEEEYIAAAKEAVAPKVTYVKTDNPELVELNKLLDLTPEQRVAAALKLDGYADKDITERVKYLKDTNQLGFEDTKITKNIRNEINRITSSVKAKNDSVQKAQAEQVAKLVTNIEKAIEQKDTIFGLSFGKDPDSIKTNKALIVNDLKKGGLGKMISELAEKAMAGEAEPLIEAYYAIKFRDKLQVGWKNKGASEASKKILDEIYNNKQQNGSYEDVKDKSPKNSDGKGKTFRD